MHVSIQLLRDEERARDALYRDGWHLRPEERGAAFRAEHPHVQDQISARRRLYELGLLTCSACRIEFER